MFLEGPNRSCDLLPFVKKSNGPWISAVSQTCSPASLGPEPPS